MVIRKEQLVQDQTGTLDGAITNVATTLDINSATGWPTSGDFRVKIEGELILVTGVSGTTWTIERGIEGTGAASHIDSATVEADLTGGALARLLRDNDPWSGFRQAYRVQDANGDPLDETDFTEIGNATYNPVISTHDGSIRITKDDQGSTDNVTALIRTPPSTPYTITAAFTHKMFGGFSGIGPVGGMFLYNNTNGDGIIFGLMPMAVNGHRMLSYTSLTSGGTLRYGTEPRGLKQPYWLRLTDDGADLSYYFAPSSGPWQLALKVPRGSWLVAAPDRIGFCFNNFRGDAVVGQGSITLVAWNEA